jgi:hypothetical protein
MLKMFGNLFRDCKKKNGLGDCQKKAKFWGTFSVCFLWGGEFCILFTFLNLRLPDTPKKASTSKKSAKKNI